MDRAFSSGASGTPPTAPVSPSIGHPTGGNPGTGTPPTKPGPYWYYMITEELRALIVAAGLTPDQSNTTQLAQAVQAMITATINQDYKVSVRYTTTGNITLSGLGTQANGDWGTALTAGDRILAKDQSTGSQNGIYIAAASAWTRATDADGAGELTSGAIVAVEEGVVHVDTQWMLVTDGIITLGSTALTFLRKDASPSAVGFRNRIINGSMLIDQRNAGASQTFTAGAVLAYCVDRWYGYCTGGNVTGQRVVGSGASMFRYQFTGAASVTKIGFCQRIERANSIDLAGGSATLSVDLANSLLTTVNWTAWYANTNDTFGTLASPTRTQIATGSFTVNSTISRYSATFAVPAGATTGIEVEFSVGAQTSGSWTIGEVQLESGVSQTAMERRLPNVEISACHRFFQKAVMPIQGTYPEAGTTGFAVWIFKTEMRVAPTVTYVGSNGSGGTPAVDGTYVSASSSYPVIGAGTTASAEL